MNLEIAVNKLIFSPKNVRTVNAGSNADKQLISSIESQGLLQNLVVKESSLKNKFEVIAGGRRLAALQYLVKNKKFKKDHLVECLLIDSDNAAEISLSENVVRANMHPADEFMAYQKMINENSTIKDIACHFGTTQNTVKRRLKLASVSPLIIAAFKADKLSLECVMSFTVCDDHEQQEVCFKHFSSKYYAAHSIKSFLLSESILSSHSLATFVGLKAYKKAGGTISSDLFSNEIHLRDMSILVSLAENQLNLAREELLSEEWKWVEIMTNGSPDIHEYHLIDATPVNVPKKLEIEIAKLREREEVLDNMTSEEWTDELEQELDNIQDRIEDIEQKCDKYGVFCLEDRSYSGCIVYIDRLGVLAIQKGMVKPADFKVKTQAESKPTKEGNVVESNIPESSEYPQSLSVDINLYKQQIVKSKIAESVEFASDLLIFTLSRDLLIDGYCSHPLNLNCSATNSKPKLDDLNDTKAGEALTELYRKLDVSYLRAESSAESFLVFQKLNRSQKDLIMAYVTASIFNLSDCLTDEVLINQLDIDFAKDWRPTHDNFFSRIRRNDLLDLGKEWQGDEWFSDNLKQKKKELSQSLHDIFHSDEKLNDSLMAIRNEWLPNGFLEIASN